MAWRTEEDWRIHREDILRLQMKVRRNKKSDRRFTTAIIAIVVLANVLALIADNMP